MVEQEQIYLSKAIESLAGAESEYVNGRFNNCANRCYYACFQAGVHALGTAGILPSGSRASWAHDRLQAEFVGQLINRRKRYAGELRDVLVRTYTLRETADYKADRISETQAYRALRRARQFIAAIGEGDDRGA